MGLEVMGGAPVDVMLILLMPVLVMPILVMVGQVILCK